MPKEIVVPKEDQMAYERFHFAQAAKANGLVICSGQLGTAADGSVPDSVEEEFHNAWASVGRVLREAGLDYGDIVDITSFHVGLRENLGAFVKVKDEFVKEPYPAWTAIGISELAVEGARVEIRVIGMVI